MRVLRQAIRGCFTLPHVGAHPGNFWLWSFVAMGALSGTKGGIWGALVGAAAMLVGVGLPYLVGAYKRAEESDAAQQHKGEA